MICLFVKRSWGKRFLATISCFIFCGAALADRPPGQLREQNWMQDVELQAAFNGKVVTGYHSGGFPFTETYAKDGGISYWQPGIVATGRWHITGREFCTFYEDLNGGCFLTRKVGDNCFQFYLTENQESGPLTQKEGTPYVSQVWYPDRKSTCEDLTT
jgi:hypothetical protein